MYLLKVLHVFEEASDDSSLISTKQAGSHQVSKDSWAAGGNQKGALGNRETLYVSVIEN